MTVMMSKWQSAMQPPEAVAFFRGLFERAGVRVTDTGEAFTCVHHGSSIEFVEGLDEESVDFTVEITSADVDLLLADIADVNVAGRLIDLVLRDSVMGLHGV